MTTQSTGALGADKAIAHGAMLRDVAVATLLGLALVGLAGFAGADALHAAAHDTRHATGFPCH